MPPPTSASRTIFVANIPYDVSEEQLASTFSEAGPVNNVEIKFDPQTGRSKGYAFVQFYDEATALSAVRNLQEVPVNGRNLRVELSTDEPGPRRGGRGSRGGIPGHPAEDTPPRGYDAGPPVNRVDLSALPEGAPLPHAANATDSISKTLATVTPGQMQDVMASMKSLITTNPEQARQLLSSKPQLAYALFQAMLLMNIVDPSVLQRIQPLPATAPPPPSNYPPPAQNAYPAYPPASSGPSYPPGGAGYRPPPQQGGYNSAPPAAGYGTPSYGATTPAPPQPPASGMAALPPSAQQALATLPEDQQQMLLQVLQLTPDQINALDATQKASIMQLRQQFLGTAA
ncbi:hypothetical protein L486_07158 [Kwoniella mangroviensis CBS 10435]|uniref:RRM domain-containing protein n=1 Tax=Kwoniella mangroviensis CBS 10435 TaxID=1331196 RepID=A0A1B9IH81_9TREE|nr:uncharacterized protein I203_08450 [Kwoniella mangroviensis CBS 8507]OCF55048.1 hypothetical protein L486_07158 [Kwoniella mangroviensis CBS 10435]OCF62478.1 hypothetical protein I203_08450 [Kwoniella mangroviensis CBS 8507]OCF72230.1 hypothetical protein I204_07495 [Kwoniella mangroviensis CBS 8886]